MDSDRWRLPEEAEGLPEAFRHGNQMKDETLARSGRTKSLQAGHGAASEGIAIGKPIV